MSAQALIDLMQQRARKAPTMAWAPLPAVEGRTACLTCGAGADKSDSDFLVAVGFGSAAVTVNGSLVIDEQEWIDGEFGEGTEVTLSLVERVAKLRPDADWRISMHAPLYGHEYQRQGEDRWVLVHSDEGFA